MKNKILQTGESGYRPIRKITVALRGVYYAIIMDFSVAYKIILSLLLMTIFFYYRQWVDFGIVLLATAIVIIAEMFNTTIELLCDFIEEKQNEKIGIIKDVAAGTVGVSIFVWFIITLIEVIHICTLFFGD